MNVVVDALTSTTGWAGTGAVSASGVNEVEGYIAGDQAASLVASFPAGSLDDTLTKSFSVDVSDCDQLVVSVWSRNRGRGTYRQFSDCPYSLVINGTEEYGIRCWLTFTHDMFDITDIDTITSIAIKANHDEEDYLVLSYMVASKDELPYDLFHALQHKLESYRDAEVGDGLEVGTCTAAAGDTVIDIVGSIGHLWRYTVITIDDGENAETHQLGDLASGGFEMSSLFDGQAILNDFTDAAVYVQFPINIYQQEKEVMFPSVTLHGMDVEPVRRDNEIEQLPRSFRPDGFTVEHEHIYLWPINLEITSRSLELNALMATFVRKAMAGHKIWVNGRFVALDFEAAAIEEEPVDSVDVIPRLAYTVNIEIKERVWRKSQVPSLTATPTFTPVTVLP